MEYGIMFRVIGVVVAIAGVVLVVNPELVSKEPIPTDVFEAVERRIWWGSIIGLGVLLLLHHQLRPWLMTLAASGAALTFGLLAARLIGIALDGSVAMQWFWVVVETVILVGLLYWHRTLRTK